MAADGPTDISDDEDPLLSALHDEDAEKAGDALRRRQEAGERLTSHEMEALADLLQGCKNAELYYRKRLAFVAWKPGRPRHDPYEARLASQRRARKAERLIRDGALVKMAVSIVAEAENVSASTARNDLKGFREMGKSKAKKTGEFSGPDFE